MPNLPGVNHLAAVRALEKAGSWVARQGKQIVMTDGSRIITIPRHNPINAITMGNIKEVMQFLHERPPLRVRQQTYVVRGVCEPVLQPPLCREDCLGKCHGRQSCCAGR